MGQCCWPARSKGQAGWAGYALCSVSLGDPGRTKRASRRDHRCPGRSPAPCRTSPATRQGGTGLAIKTDAEAKVMDRPGKSRIDRGCHPVSRRPVHPVDTVRASVRRDCRETHVQAQKYAGRNLALQLMRRTTWDRRAVRCLRTRSVLATDRRAAAYCTRTARLLSACDAGHRYDEP